MCHYYCCIIVSLYHPQRQAAGSPSCLVWPVLQWSTFFVRFCPFSALLLQFSEKESRMLVLLLYDCGTTLPCGSTVNASCIRILNGCCLCCVLSCILLRDVRCWQWREVDFLEPCENHQKKKTDKQKRVRMRQPVTLTGKVVLSFSSLASCRIKSLAAALGNGCGLAGAHGGNGAGPNPRGLPDGF